MARDMRGCGCRCHRGHGDRFFCCKECYSRHKAQQLGGNRDRQKRHPELW